MIPSQAKIPSPNGQLTNKIDTKMFLEEMGKLNEKIDNLIMIVKEKSEEVTLL